MTPEHLRLDEADQGKARWKKWGPYLSERQWGTVREDYSDNGNAWDYFSHDQSRSRTYRWGEDGLAGYSDDHQGLCFALALWNGKDPILKERLFGLTNSEGNHGEDVKEYYYYLDSTPTHSYMKYLYKYPQAAYPYDDIVRTNRGRTRTEMEYELLDTGVFGEDKYFDVFVEYAKKSPEDTLIEVTAHNRGPEVATLHLLPHLWFRNTWSWKKGGPRPEISKAGENLIRARYPEGGAERFLYCDGASELLFTENETNSERLFQQPNSSPYVKDAFHRYLIADEKDAVNPASKGTKSAAHWEVTIPAGGSKRIRLRLTDQAPGGFDPWADFDATVAQRKSEADEFYTQITPPSLTADQANVMRQALAGMLWTKQYYYFDLDTWLEEHGVHPILTSHKSNKRNRDWFHMLNDDIISMPDKWEYPWYAAWDLAFHAIPLCAVDVQFAKKQLSLMLEEMYLHPNGQIPAYEWNFGDVNPPVHAWSANIVYMIDKDVRGKPDLAFLRNSFQKLMLNFNWWVNRKDPSGRNVFQGGFLGLDNIGVFDRSSALPTGGYLEQADGTAWMAFFAQNMLEMSLELAKYDPIYEEWAAKYAEHFFYIASAMDRVGNNKDEMWDEEDGFFYDVLVMPNGDATRLKVRSMVGLLPLAATAVFPAELLERFPRMRSRVRTFLERLPEVAVNIHSPLQPGKGGTRMLSIMNESKLRRVLSRMLDENEFLGPYGLRSLSKYHDSHPFSVNVHGEEFRVSYLPAESDSGMFGGNSNWRGPVWMPVNILMIRALGQFQLFYGDDFKIECPTGSGNMMTLFEVSKEIGRRLSRIFERDEQGKRPVFGGAAKFQEDPHWRDHLLFYEYFHGDNGAGLGASHQTGWTGVVARLIQFFGFLPTSREFNLAGGNRPMLRSLQREVGAAAAAVPAGDNQPD